MKPLMILGSLVGFVIGAGFSMAGDCPWATVFWRASVAALLAAILARWWSRLWFKGLQNTAANRRNGFAKINLESKTPAKS